MALANGHVIIALTGYNEDLDKTYHGWVVSYDATTLQQTGIFCTSCVGSVTGSGIWQSGRAPVVDDQGNVYLFTGNAFVPDYNHSNAYDGVNNFSESLLKFEPVSLTLLDWFTPSKWSTLDKMDWDLSSSGATLLPGSNLLVGGGKNGVVYLWDTNNLGEYVQNDTQVLQSFPLPDNTNHVYGGPVFWTRDSDEGSSVLYDFGSSSPIYAYKFNRDDYNFDSTPFSKSSTDEAKNTGDHSAVSLSANAEEHGTGVIWQLQNVSANKTGSILRAFDALDLTNELWNSNIYAADKLSFGTVNYVPPTIANGKVYANVYSGLMSVYGLDSLSINQPVDKVSFLGKATTVQISALDSNFNKLTYTAQGLPPGFKINTKGLINGTGTAVGQYNVSVSVNNQRETPETVYFNWIVAAAPTITLPNPQSTSLNNLVSLPIVASDNGLTIKYTAKALPKGLSIDSASGVITGISTKIGTFSPIVIATNPYGQQSSVNFSWTVTKQ